MCQVLDSSVLFKGGGVTVDGSRHQQPPPRFSTDAELFRYIDCCHPQRLSMFRHGRRRQFGLFCVQLAAYEAARGAGPMAQGETAITRIPVTSDFPRCRSLRLLTLRANEGEPSILSNI